MYSIFGIGLHQMFLLWQKYVDADYWNSAYVSSGCFYVLVCDRLCDPFYARTTEIGICNYELIGMEAKTVRNLFLAENSIIGIGAFSAWFFGWYRTSGFAESGGKNIFEVPHTISGFSSPGMGSKYFCFCLDVWFWDA